MKTAPTDVTVEGLDDAVMTARKYVGTPDADDADEYIVALAERIAARDLVIADLIDWVASIDKRCCEACQAAIAHILAKHGMNP